MFGFLFPAAPAYDVGASDKPVVAAARGCGFLGLYPAAPAYDLGAGAAAPEAPARGGARVLGGIFPAAPSYETAADYPIWKDDKE